MVRERLGELTYIYGDEVFQRLAHLQSLNVQVTRVQKVVDPLAAVVVSLEMD